MQGQDLARDVLVRALAARRVPHAYLFAGPAGVGKRAAAYGLAMALSCDVAPGRGCGACETCRRIREGAHPDTVLFAPDGPWLLVEQAQAIVALGRSGPHEAHARVLVLEDAERMNPNAANALLKTLEEPAANTHLVLLTTAPDRVLPTINSRTQRLRFKRLPHATLVRLAEARGFDGARAAVAATLADGSAAALFDFLEGARQAPLEEAVTRLRAAAQGRGASVIFEAASAVADQAKDSKDKDDKETLPAVLLLLQRLYRDGLAHAVGAPELAVLGAPSDADDPTSVSAKLAADVPRNLPAPALLRALTASLEAEAALLGNVNGTFVYERLLMQLRRQEKWARA